MTNTTVIIPTRGLRQQMLEEAINSVKNQTKQCELLICDGLKNINSAIEKAKGPYIVILCDDDKLNSRYVEILEPLIENNDLVSTPLENFGDENGIHSPGTYPFISSIFRKKIAIDCGGFDFEGIGAMADVDFWWRYLKIGKRWFRYHEPLFMYRYHSGNESKVCDWVDSRKKVLLKNPDYSW